MTAFSGRLTATRLTGVGAVSSAILVLELGLTRILSVTTWYHFAFFAISLALLGLGASGVFVHVTPRLHTAQRVPSHLLLYGILFAAATLVLAFAFPLTPLGAAATGGGMWLLAAAYLIGAAPFFAGGAFLALAVSRFREDVNRVYAADLIGAAAGCLIFIVAIDSLGGAGPPLVACVLALAGGALAGGARKGLLIGAALVMGAIVAVLMLAQARTGLMDVTYAKGERLPDPLFSAWNSYSRVAVRPQQHISWGMSTRVPFTAPSSITMDIDASASTPILLADSTADVDSLRYDASSLGHRLLPAGGHVLVIGPGGGQDIWTALLFGADRVTGVEVNSIIVEVMLDDYWEPSGGIYTWPGVEVDVDDGRNFIASSSETYDLIQASLVDTWAASSAGAFALTENNLYTVEAFVEYLEHLTPEGVLSVSRWRSDAIRLLALTRAAVDRLGWPDLASRVFVAASPELPHNPGLATLVVARHPLSPSQVALLAGESDRLGFDVLYAPGLPRPRRDDRYIRLTTDLDPEPLYEESATDISPVTDDRPFFFQSSKIESPGDLLEGGFGATPAEGVDVLMRLLVVSVGLTACLVLLPLRLAKRHRQSPVRLAGIGYFGCLGVGFMLVEISLIQRFVLFLGHPVYALTVVLFTFLLGAGLGSAASRAYVDAARALRPVLVTVAAACLLYAFLLPDLLSALLGLDRLVRIALALVLLLPLGLVMGMPLPTGVRVLSRSGEDEVAWAWGINGAASVLGSTLAVLLALGWGFTVVTVAGSAVYLLALVLAGLPWSAAKGSPAVAFER